MMKLRYPFFKHLAPTYYARTRNALELIPKKGKILDLGCGDGAYTREIVNNNLIVGSDFDFDILPKEKYGNSFFINANAEVLPFKDKSFDSVICVDVIEHVKNDLKVFKEISRVLKKDGYLVMSTPNSNFPFLYDPINFILKPFKKHLPIGIWGFGHKRVYSFNRFKELLEMHNLKILESRFSTHEFMGLIENYGSDIMRSLTDKKKSKKSNFVKILLPFIDLGYKIEKRCFKKSKKSVGMMVLAKKC